MMWRNYIGLFVVCKKNRSIYCRHKSILHVWGTDYPFAHAFPFSSGISPVWSILQSQLVSFPKGCEEGGKKHRLHNTVCMWGIEGDWQEACWEGEPACLLSEERNIILGMTSSEEATGFGLSQDQTWRQHPENTVSTVISVLTPTGPSSQPFTKPWIYDAEGYPILRGHHCNHA